LTIAENREAFFESFK